MSTKKGRKRKKTTWYVKKWLDGYLFINLKKNYSQFVNIYESLNSEYDPKMFCNSETGMAVYTSCQWEAR